MLYVKRFVPYLEMSEVFTSCAILIEEMENFRISELLPFRKCDKLTELFGVLVVLVIYAEF